MKVIEMKIIDPAGLHARPASLLVKEASKFKSDVELESGEKKTTLKSILGIMSLGVKADTDIKIYIDGEDESIAKESITKFLVDNNLAV
ncbi:MAG: HPr family phosphocarrier protein [Clostridiales bacterium]|nr:HPr family phosphocarrier protein [Clostridiales bacterium]